MDYIRNCAAVAANRVVWMLAGICLYLLAIQTALLRPLALEEKSVYFDSVRVDTGKPADKK